MFFIVFSEKSIRKMTQIWFLTAFVDLFQYIILLISSLGYWIRGLASS